MKPITSEKKVKIKSNNDEDIPSATSSKLSTLKPFSQETLPTRKYQANWQEIVEEGNQRTQEILDYIESKKSPLPKSPFLNTESDYLKEQVFTQLLPALEEALVKAKIWNALNDPKCFFNGLDHVAQVIWNNNPQHPERREQPLHIFNMPWARDILRENPRPFYPKSWLWTQEHAATVIQKYWRQYLVHLREDVEEMRDFWRKLTLERHNTNFASNPLLSKKFASSRELHDPKRVSTLTTPLTGSSNFFASH